MCMLKTLRLKVESSNDVIMSDCPIPLSNVSGNWLWTQRFTQNVPGMQFVGSRERHNPAVGWAFFGCLLRMLGRTTNQNNQVLHQMGTISEVVCERFIYIKTWSSFSFSGYQYWSLFDYTFWHMIFLYPARIYLLSVPFLFLGVIYPSHVPLECMGSRQMSSM